MISEINNLVFEWIWNISQRKVTVFMSFTRASENVKTALLSFAFVKKKEKERMKLQF